MNQVILQHRQLPNGLTIIGEPRPSARSMAAGFFVRTGARDETPEVSGVSHFLEHMVFKGSDARPAEAINREFDEIGADYNAFTSEETTVFYGAVLPEFQGRLLDLLADMMRPALRDDDFAMEKNVILEEIAMYQDDPHAVVFDALRSFHFVGHPLQNSILGTTESISALSAEAMRGYFQRRYVPGNITLVLVGNYHWDAALESAARHCGGWAPGQATRVLRPHEAAPQTRVITDARLNRAHIAIAAGGVAAQDPAERAAHVTADILGGARGSRLYWNLVEPGLADAAQLGHDEGDGTGWFAGYVSCDPERVQEVHRRLLDTLLDASTGNVQPGEAARAARKNAAGHVISSETPMGRLVPLGFDWLYRGEVTSVDAEADALLQIAAADCNAVLAAHPLAPLTSVILGPIDEGFQVVADAD